MFSFYYPLHYQKWNIIQTRMPFFFFFWSTILTPTHACVDTQRAASASILSTSYQTENSFKKKKKTGKNAKMQCARGEGGWGGVSGGGRLSTWTRCSLQLRFRWVHSELQLWNLHPHVFVPTIPSYSSLSALRWRGLIASSRGPGTTLLLPWNRITLRCIDLHKQSGWRQGCAFFFLLSGSLSCRLGEGTCPRESWGACAGLLLLWQHPQLGRVLMSRRTGETCAPQHTVNWTAI